MGNRTACKDRGMALAILRTIVEGMKEGTQKSALESVTEWIQGQHIRDDAFFKMTREEREARIEELLAKERDLMPAERRKEKAAFYLEGITA